MSATVLRGMSDSLMEVTLPRTLVFSFTGYVKHVLWETIYVGRRTWTCIINHS